MKNGWKVLIVVSLVLAVGFVLWGKSRSSGPSPCGNCKFKADAAEKTTLPVEANLPVENNLNVEIETPAAEELKNIDASLQNKVEIAIEDTKQSRQEQQDVIEAVQPAVVETVVVKKTEVVKLARLVELGSDRCMPCKMMKPILEELKIEYKNKLLIEFYDVWKNVEYGRKFGVRVIPTQIFFDSDGKELFRHEGFYSKENILAKFKELGIDLDKAN